MAFTQLDPPIPLHVVDRGSGFAVAVIDYGQEFDLLWVVGRNLVRSQSPGPPAGQLVDGPQEGFIPRRAEDCRLPRLINGRLTAFGS